MGKTALEALGNWYYYVAKLPMLWQKCNPEMLNLCLQLGRTGASQLLRTQRTRQNLETDFAELPPSTGYRPCWLVCTTQARCRHSSPYRDSREVARALLRFYLGMRGLPLVAHTMGLPWRLRSHKEWRRLYQLHRSV